MAPMQFAAAYQTNMLAHWDNVTAIRKPIIAAVNGFALGGGCEGFCDRRGFVLWFVRE
jgi:enoyl-CoA hydratase/carnithine racemase